MPSPKIDVQVGAQIAEFQKAMNDAAASFRALTGSISKEAPKAANEAMSGFDKMSHGLREWRSEHVQEERAIKTFTNAIQGLGLVSKDTAGVLGGLAGGFAMGGVIGVSVEAAKILVEKVREFGNAGEEAFRDWVTASNLAFQKTGDALDAARKKAMGMTPAGEAQERIMLLRAEKELTEADIAAQERVKTIATEALAKERDRFSGTAERYRVQIEGADRSIEQLRVEIALQDRAIERQAKLAQYAIEAADRAAKEEKDKKEAAAAAALADQQVNDILKGIAGDRAAMEKEAAEAEKKYQEELRDAGAEAKRIANARKADAAEDQAFRERRTKALIDEQKQWVELGDHISKAFAQGFTRALFHARSFGDAMASIYEGLLSMVERLVEQVVEKFIASKMAELIQAKVSALSETQGNIAIAVSGAAASQASIPFAGPALAAAAASSMLATLEAMTAPLLAARGGFDVPAGVNPLTQLHEKEMVLPAHLAEPLRKSLAGGGVGGAVTINITAMDGRDVYRVLTNSQTDVHRFLRETSPRWSR